MGPLFGNFDLIYQGGDIEFEDPAYQDLDHNAWLGNLTVGYKFSDKFKMYANVLYVSGDDDPTDDDVENFNSIDVDVKVGRLFLPRTACWGIVIALLPIHPTWWTEA